jgi:hypothetical protein
VSWTELDVTLMNAPNVRTLLSTHFEMAEETAEDRSEEGIRRCAVNSFMDNLQDGDRTDAMNTMTELVASLCDMNRDVLESLQGMLLRTNYVIAKLEGRR